MITINTNELQTYLALLQAESWTPQRSIVIFNMLNVPVLWWRIAVITNVFLGTSADLSRSVCLPVLGCCAHLKLFQPLLVCWNLFAWLLSHNFSILSSAKFSFHNGTIQSSLNSKERFALAPRDFGSYFSCLPAKCLPWRQSKHCVWALLWKSDNG